jgi:hypothetical protein
MTRIQALLETANRMIEAGIDEKLVAEILVEQIKENLQPIAIIEVEALKNN